MKKKIFLLITTIFLSSCKEEKPNSAVDYLTLYAFVNNSGVEVAIVPKGTGALIPDSLVLQDGGSYFWSVNDPYPINKNNDPVCVYFDKTVASYYEGYPGTPRDPRHAGQYTGSIVKDGLKYNVYTFTVEDYQWALEQNNTKE